MAPHPPDAGFEIALACDCLLASPAAFFLDTHCKFGLMPSWGLSQILPRLMCVCGGGEGHCHEGLPLPQEWQARPS